MIRTEYYKTREDGANLYRTFSDNSLQIRKIGTEEIYDEAIDVEYSLFGYIETETPIYIEQSEEQPPTV